MEFFLYFIIFIVIVSVVAGFVQSVIHPPIDVLPENLPAVILREIQSSVGPFVSRHITLQRVRHRYLIQGEFEGRPCELQADLTPDGELARIELRSSNGSHKFKKTRLIPSISVPVVVADRLGFFLAIDRSPINIRREFAGRIDSEDAFLVEVQSEEFEYRFEIFSTGQLAAFTKTSLA